MTRPPVTSATLQVRVVGPDSLAPTAADLRRLFSHRLLTRARRDRLGACTRVLATHGARLVGLASFERVNDDVRVHEFAFDADAQFSPHVILRQLLDALELACLASGGRRLVLLPQAVLAITPFERLGYHLVNEGCAGAWLEKTLA